MPTNNIKEGYFTDYISGLPVKETPEELEAVQPFSKILVDDYGYPKEFIHTRPQYRVKARPSDRRKEYPVDIAVFNSSVHDEKSIYIIVECKKKNRKDGRDQLEDYLRFSNASLGVWFNGEERLYLHKVIKDNEIQFREIPISHATVNVWKILVCSSAKICARPKISNQHSVQSVIILPPMPSASHAMKSSLRS